MTAIKTRAAKTVKERDAKLKAHFVKLLPADNRPIIFFIFQEPICINFLTLRKRRIAKHKQHLVNMALRKIPNR